MEKKIYSIPNRPIINLKNLPPIDPNIITNTHKNQSSQVKSDVWIDIPVSKVIKASPKQEKELAEDDHKALVTSNSAYTTTQPHDLRAKYASFGSSGCKKCTNKTHENRASPTYSTLEGNPKQGSAKSRLHELCAANKWRSPLFECCKEEGPSHMKMFTFKVVVEIRAPSNTVVLECFGAPQSKKKTAVEHAAEGALWYLKHTMKCTLSCSPLCLPLSSSIILLCCESRLDSIIKCKRARGKSQTDN